MKHKILAYLEQNRGHRISGEALANLLGISRGGVWKAIKALKAEGFVISAIPSKGYSLADTNDILSSAALSPYITSKVMGQQITVHKTIPSTNEEAAKLARSGAPEGTVVLAEEQTAGKGRMGRSFYSPHGTGIYLSIVLRPQLSAEYCPLITAAAAVATAQVLEQLCGEAVLIKWVNDIYMRGRKVCGILTEGLINFENGSLTYAVLGIGINVRTIDFPDEIKSVAGSIGICDNEMKRGRIICMILDAFERIYTALPQKDFMAEYRSRSFILGKDIEIIFGNEMLNAKAIDIDSMGHLIVRLPNGDMKVLHSGEVSIKAWQGEN